MTHVTMEDVAKAAGVSRALVSIAYRGVPGVSDATRERIFETGDRLGYVPNQVAARLAGKSRKTIGVFQQDMHNEVFADVHDGIRDVTSNRDVSLVLAVASIDGSRDAQALGELLASRVDIIIATGLTIPDVELASYAKRVPMVSIARHVNGFDNVDSDNFGGATLATEHLIELGHTRVLFLSNPQTDGYTDRQRGYRDAMNRAGLEPWVIETTYSRDQAEIDAGSALDGESRPTAIFAHNDRTALGVLDALTTRGLAPGKDVSVVGYDNTSASRAPGLALTTVDIHAIEQGRAAAELALSRLNNPTLKPRVTTIAPTLVVRGTTGAPH